MSQRRDEMPPRLLEGEGEAAELLRKVERQPRHAPSEAAARERTLTLALRTSFDRFPGRIAISDA